MRLVAQLGDAYLGRVEAEQRNIGRFSLRGILAGGLAEAVRGTFDVEHVINNLKTQPDRRGVAIECVALRLIERPTASRSQAHRSMDQRPRFECMHALEFIQTQCIPHVRKIEGLVGNDERVLLFNCANGNKYPLPDRSKTLKLAEADPAAL